MKLSLSWADILNNSFQIKALRYKSIWRREDSNFNLSFICVISAGNQSRILPCVKEKATFNFGAFIVRWETFGLFVISLLEYSCNRSEDKYCFFFFWNAKTILNLERCKWTGLAINQEIYMRPIFFFNLTTKIVKPCLEASKKKKTVEKLLKKLIHRTHKYDRGLKKQMVL